MTGSSHLTRTNSLSTASTLSQVISQGFVLLLRILFHFSQAESGGFHYWLPHQSSDQCRAGTQRRPSPPGGRGGVRTCCALAPGLGTPTRTMPCGLVLLERWQSDTRRRPAPPRFGMGFTRERWDAALPVWDLPVEQPCNPRRPVPILFCKD